MDVSERKSNNVTHNKKYTDDRKCEDYVYVKWGY